MLPFSTEFPVLPSDNRAAFAAEVVAWLRGMQHQTVLSSKSEAELDGANVHVRSDTGEELRMRELQSSDGWSAVGVRHDFPDHVGRIWRTECVLKRAAAEGGQDLVRLKTQCIATTPGARLDTPRKPYLIKALLKNGWGGKDLQLAVSDQPVWLENNDEGLLLAKAATLGAATKWLPTVYISATGASSWVLSQPEIEKLAYDLGGIAHVVVEPDRAFSFDLREETEASNAYGGTLGLSAPGQGVVRRYYLGWQIQDGGELAAAVRIAVSNLRSQMPTFGWDWTELQEQALRAHRERERSRLTVAESEQLYLEEIENLQDKIRTLEQQLSVGPAESVGTDEGEFSTDNLVRRIGPEVYSGEISDRLRFAARTTLLVSDQIGLDGRSRAILQRIVDRLPVSPALAELTQDLARATKDPKRVASELTALLRRHGYSEKSDNKHIRLEAERDYDGLESITLPKTPSDNRGLKNLRKQIERTFGITKLAE
ncbi:hypothetical protein TG4357_00494 [Thalassovita gelatinovora]|uniref:Uncharacterized protein n=2 Tax=Thalassovita gelatinovora TaxID=53501 RepID=A0A0P1FQ12_THAGE|nr:hypothetical protein TG4357_00494 [Thalassovita gelatinovora]SER20945.1 hypothetical protein SAMN04488043_1234 [Thalassovita gelatinovora]